MAGHRRNHFIRHEWEKITLPDRVYQRARRCIHCGVVQAMECIGYDRLEHPPALFAWRPFVGNCAGRMPVTEGICQ